MSLPSQDPLTFPPAPPERCPQLSNFPCLHPISKVTHPWPHSKGACLVLASRTNSRLVASAQRSGSKGPGTVSGCGCAGRCVCWARFCTSQSGSILPGVRHLGASPCSGLTWWDFCVALSGPLSPRLSAGLRNVQVPYASHS